ncbi:hypothetical protein Tco_0966710 [Tanacetum coccineum]
MITNNNKIEGKKPSGLMLSPQLKIISMLETFLYVRNATCITQDHALSSVRLATRGITETVPRGKQTLPTKGANKRFVSISLASMLNIPPITIDTTYDIEMADGNLVGTNTYHVRIICDEKVVHIPIDGETLIIRGATLVAREPYRLDPLEIQELSYWERISHKGQKESKEQPNQARDGKDKVKSKPKSVKVRKSTK